MAADNVKRFEVRLGKWGLSIFVCGMALLIFCSFLFGVMVGKDIDAYPEKYSWGIARQILGTPESANHQATPEPHRAVASAVIRDTGKEQPRNENSEYDLSDYDTLSKKSKNLRNQPSGNEGANGLPAQPLAQPGLGGVPTPLPAPATPKISPLPAVPEAGNYTAGKPKTEQKEEKKVAEKEKGLETDHNNRSALVPQHVNEKKAAAKQPFKERETGVSAAEKKVVPKAEKNVVAEKKIDHKLEKTVTAEKKSGQKNEKTAAAAEKRPEKNSAGKELKKEEKELKPGKTTYKVQVASYREREKADQVARKLKELGYTARIVPMDLPGKGRWYRITISGLPSHQKAEEAVAKVEKKIGGSKGFIRPEDEEEDKAAVAAIARKKADEAAAKTNGVKKKTTDARGNRTQGAAN